MKKNSIWIFCKKRSLKIITPKIFVLKHSAWRQMKENYQNYLLYKFLLRPQSARWDSQLPHKKWKPCFSGICQKVEDWLRLFSPIRHYGLEITSLFIYTSKSGFTRNNSKKGLAKNFTAIYGWTWTDRVKEKYREI